MKRNTHNVMLYSRTKKYRRFASYGYLLLLLVAIIIQSCNKDDFSLDDEENLVQLTEEQQLEATAVSELASLAQTVMLDADVRKELYQISLEPIYIDRYVGLRDLLDPVSIQQHKSNGISEAGAFKRFFEKSYNPSIHTSLQLYVAKATEELSSRANDVPEEDLYFYCPYCEYYATDQVVSDGITIAEAVLGGGQTGPGEKLLSDGSYTEVTVSDDYAITTPTIIVTTEPQGIVIPDVNAEVLICETSEAGQQFRCCYYIYEGDARYSEPFGCFYQGGNGGGILEPRTNEDWLECEGFSAVYTGHIQTTELMDGFLSISDGGGNEMRLARIGAGSPYTVDDGQIETNAFAAVLSKYFTRGRIKDGFISTWGVEFDPGWECDEPDQLFVLYEEDENSTQNFSGSIGFTPTVTMTIGGLIIEAEGGEIEIDFEIEIESDDDVIWQQTYSREEYFSRNRASRGCGSYPILESETVFDDSIDHDEYARYSCNEGFVTLPDVHFE